MVQALRQQVARADLAALHRRRPTDFTRQRQLIFPVVLLLILQKSLKSLQARLHEWAGPAAPAATAGAFTRARAKLRASVFVELNRTAVLPIVYGPAHGALARHWRGHRVLGLDSSRVRLPDSAALHAHFGTVPCANRHGAQGSFPEARVSVLYDLRHDLALDGVVVGSRTGERALVAAHLPHAAPGDVLVTDRGYTSWQHFAQVRAAGLHFVARCSRQSFAAVQVLFAADRAGVSQVVTLPAPPPRHEECRRADGPLELRVRLVTVRLSTGQLEVLATSLLDETAYPTAELATVYGWRWGQETFYGRLKGRLDLEHCSGQTVAAVEQDFAATLLLANVESVLRGPAQAQLDAGAAGRTQPGQVNRAVSLHALKTRLLDLLASAVPAEQVLAELTRWFVQNPVSVRPARQVPRRVPSSARSYHYQRRVRKIIF